MITTLANHLHGFESGDHVSFREVQGMVALNGTTHRIEGNLFCWLNWWVFHFIEQNPVK